MLVSLAVPSLAFLFIPANEATEVFSQSIVIGDERAPSPHVRFLLA